jgi:hypothetical protein
MFLFSMPRSASILSLDYYYNAKLVICRISMRRVTKLDQAGRPSAKPSVQAHLCDFAL